MTQSADVSLCDLCGESLRCTWTDTHGVAVCTTCNLPYRLLHYEGDGPDRRRVDKPPELAIHHLYLPLLRLYWSERHKRVLPGLYDLTPGRGSQDLCSRADYRDWAEWERAHEAEIEAVSGEVREIHQGAATALDG
jgi:hypothetical protein